jgi:hypothetical protein
VVFSSRRAAEADGNTDRVMRACSRLTEEAVLDNAMAISAQTNACLFIVPSHFKCCRRN